MSYLSKEENDILKKTKMRIYALDNPMRLKILEVIKAGNGKLRVTQIYRKMGCSNPLLRSN